VTFSFEWLIPFTSMVNLNIVIKLLQGDERTLKILYIEKNWRQFMYQWILNFFSLCIQTIHNLVWQCVQIKFHFRVWDPTLYIHKYCMYSSIFIFMSCVFCDCEHDTLAKFVKCISREIIHEWHTKK
jgi:hypothetical protein